MNYIYKILGNGYKLVNYIYKSVEYGQIKKLYETLNESMKFFC